MDGFRDGKHEMLIATDIAARGLDVAEITHVINFDMPATVDDYTHRIGRTGRASQEGEAITFVVPDDEAMIRKIERLLKKPIERRLLPEFAYAEQAQAMAAKPPAPAEKPPRRRRRRSRSGPKQQGARSGRSSRRDKRRPAKT